MPDTYDRQWKALPSEVLLALIRTCIPSIEGPLTPWQAEMGVTLMFRLDGVFLVVIAGMKILLHVEYQNTLDPTMPKRIYDYDRQLELLAEQHIGIQIPVISIVVWAIPGVTPLPEYQQKLFGLTLAQKQYYEIHLSQMIWQTISDPLLLVLAPYFSTVTRQDVLPIAEQLYQEAPTMLQLPLLGAFLALSQTKFGALTDIWEIILEKVGHTMEELFEAIAKSDIGIALMERGKIEGKVEGKVEGEATGKTKEAANVLRRLWAKRFGAMPSDVDATLQLASSELLEHIIDQLVEPGYTVEQARSDLGLSTSVSIGK